MGITSYDFQFKFSDSQEANLFMKDIRKELGERDVKWDFSGGCTSITLHIDDEQVGTFFMLRYAQNRV